jgi:predicted DNA-binding transcriptional regulator YafY
MSDATVNHELLVIRLSHILFKLNQGESIDPRDLVDEFKVSVRTIQRDLNERLAYLPIEKVKGKYRLNNAYLGKLGSTNIQSFASLAGISGLFPYLNATFVKQLVQQSADLPFQVHGHDYEQFNEVQKKVYCLLEQSISDRQQLSFLYTKSTGEQKSYQDVSPYRLINNKGIWYLAGEHQDKLKAFAFTRIQQLTLQQDHFIPDLAMIEQLDQEDSIWLGEKQTVLLKVTGEAMHYFTRRQLVPQQELVEQKEDYLIISTQITHENQILPIVRYWIPFVSILEPSVMAERLLYTLLEYARIAKKKE